MQKNNFVWAFFGTSEFSVETLNELKKNGLVPNLIVTVEDKPKGRKLIITPPETKVWAEKEGVPILQLKTLKNSDTEKTIKGAINEEFDVFVVASYGKIIPENILNIPKYKTLNIHPSLLPKLRGASPIQSAILKENQTGVSIIRLDTEVDHGPLIAQKKIEIEWPPYASDLEKLLAKESAQLLVKILPDWVGGKLKEVVQEHSLATFTEKINKIDAQLNMQDAPELNLRKIRAFHVWPGAFFFINGKRIIVKTANIDNGLLVIDRVVPEGKKEMSYKDYLNGVRSTPIPDQI